MSIRLINTHEKLPQEISAINIVLLLKKEIAYLDTSLPLFGIHDNNFKTFKGLSFSVFFEYFS